MLGAIWIVFGSFVHICSLAPILITNRTHHRGADQGPGVPGGLGVLWRTARFTPIFALIYHRHRMLDLLPLLLSVEWNCMTPFIYLPLNHPLRQYMVWRLWAYMEMWYSLGVRGLPLRRRWIGLCRRNEQCNSISDWGLGACVGHALRVPMAGTRVPAMGTDPSGSKIV